MFLNNRIPLIKYCKKCINFIEMIFRLVSGKFFFENLIKIRSYIHLLLKLFHFDSELNFTFKHYTYAVLGLTNIWIYLSYVCMYVCVCIHNLQARIVFIALFAIRIETIRLRALLGGLVFRRSLGLFTFRRRRCLLHGIARSWRQMALGWRMSWTHTEIATFALSKCAACVGKEKQRTRQIKMMCKDVSKTLRLQPEAYWYK